MRKKSNAKTNTKNSVKATAVNKAPEAVKNTPSKKIAKTTIEFAGLSVTMDAIETAVTKEIEAKGFSGKEILVYVNAEQKAAYYTVDGQGSEDYKVDLNTL